MKDIKLNIRRFLESDLEALSVLLADEKVMEYLEPPYSYEASRRFLHEFGLIEDPLVYAVEEDGSFIGYVIYHDYDNDSREIGWVLDKSVWSKGYATYLNRILIDKAFKENRDVVIECDPRQSVTRHIAMKSGFVFQGKRDGLEIYRLSRKAQSRKNLLSSDDQEGGVMKKKMIVHCMKKDLWEKRKEMEYWGEEELARDGFIHCSVIEYLWRILPRFEDDEDQYVILLIDEELLENEVRYEEADRSGRFYPHIYGPVNSNAVTMVLDYLKDEDGHYMKNPEFGDIMDR